MSEHIRICSYPQYNDVTCPVFKIKGDSTELNFLAISRYTEAVFVSSSVHICRKQLDVPGLLFTGSVDTCQLIRQISCDANMTGTKPQDGRLSTFDILQRPKEY